MKRSNGEGSIREKRKGLYEGRYTEGWDENGKQILRSVYGKTKKEVIAKLNDIHTSLDKGTYVRPDDITFGEWLDIWLRDYVIDVKPATKAQYAYQIRTNIKPALGSFQLQKLTATMIQQFYNAVQHPHDVMWNNGQKRHSMGLSPKSVKNMHSVIHDALKQAVLCQYLRSNPSESCRLPRVKKKEMLILQDDTLKAFLKQISGQPYEDLLLIDLFTGMRESEIVGLTWDCVDEKRRLILISKQLKRERQAGGGNVYTFDTLKNDKSRVISPAQLVFDRLRSIKKKQAEDKLKSGSANWNPDNLVFTNPDGTHISTATLYKYFKKYAAAIGQPDLRFHDLRHTYATLSLQNGDDIKTVSGNLGHATVAFTLDIYGHVTDQMKRDSADRMQAFYESVST